MTVSKLFTEDIDAIYRNQRDTPRYCLTADITYPRMTSPLSRKQEQIHAIHYFESKKEVESELLRQVAAVSNLTKKEIKKAPWFVNHYPYVEYKDEDNAVRYEWRIKELP